MPRTRGKYWRVMPALIATAGLGTIAPVQATARTATVTTVYVASYTAGSITPVNAATGRAGPAIRVPGHPRLLAASTDGRYVYAGTDIGITPIDTATGQAGPLIPVTFPVAMAVHGQTLWVLGDGGLTPVSTVTNTAGPVIPNPEGGQLMVLTPDGKQAYVGNRDDGVVTPVNLTTGTAGTPVVTGIADGSDPVSLAVTPDGKTVYAAGDQGGGSGGIVPIDTAANTVGPVIRVPGIVFPAMQVTPDGKTLWAVTTNGFLDRVSVASGKPLPAIRIRGYLSTLTLTPSTVYVGQYFSWGRVVPVNAATGIRGPDIPGARFIVAAALAPDGKTLWALGADSRTVVPVSVATNQPGRPVPVGADPEAVVVVCHRT